MVAFVDLVRFNPTAGGTTDWTFSSAVGGCQSPAAAGVVNGATYEYYAVSEDLTQWEAGQGVYNTSTGILSRTTVLYNSSGTGSATGQSGAGTKISFTVAPQVSIVALKESLTVTQAAAKSDQIAATSVSVAVVPAIQQNHPSAAKAWVTFVPGSIVGACVINDSFNVSGVSRTSTGLYVVTFTTPFTTANYVPGVFPIGATGGQIGRTTSTTASAATITTENSAFAVVDPTSVAFVAFGTQ
jgi:hypothetical protein